MKRSLFTLLSLMLTIVVSAGNVTPEEALQQATKFMKERVAKGTRRAPAAASSLTMAKNVSGLYVINVGQNDGFVIVSPDDRTNAILGYADSGTLDPDNMPDNMRSWLQGYADEIKWLNEHNYQPSAARRAASEVKEPIAPLLTSHWNQDAPYNNQVKTFAPDSTSGVTGCVITALGQVMYYTAKRAGLETSKPTVDIPGYKCSSGMEVPGVSVDEVIRWDLMRDTYNKEDVDEGAEAVAALMRICGAAMQVDYQNSVTGGQGEDIPPVLKYYFGYAETIQTADRSYYSYANWIEMVYNELKQERAVVYGGQSISSGHEFVCDGYQGEDYFHINWGWGGLSDGYFQLSVLNTREQGIGGSSSDDGYSTGQHAIIGFQLEGGTGTVLSNPNNVDLTLNSVTTDKDTLNVGETAHITFNITNNSSDDYDGEFGFYFFENGLGDGKMFMVPAGATQDCVMDFHPTSVGTYKITAYKTNGRGKFSKMSNDIFVKLVVTDTIEANPVTDEIDLVSTLVVENSELKKFYGTTFKATLTIKNPEPDTDYAGYYEYLFQKREGKSWKTVTYNSSKIEIHANDSLVVPLVLPGLVVGDKIRLMVTQYYLGAGQWRDWQYISGEYTCAPAITTYVADGTMSVVPTSGTRYDAPEGVVFVNISGMGITDVTHAEPNCIFLRGTADAIPTGATNYVQYDGNKYTAPNLTLTNDHDFYTPVDFMADNIEFTYNCDRWADGTNGWNTIMLPFDVTSVTADGTPIDWYHNDSDTGKQFWLKEFVSDDTDVVNFDYVSDMMKANTPYIIALPGNHWGAEMDLTGKTVKFIGSGVVMKSAPSVLTASHYRFVADTKADNIENIYCINSVGSKFELKATGGSKAFHPFFKPGIYDRDSEKIVPTVEYIAIGGNSETTGISTLNVERVTMNEIYNLNGQRVAQPKNGLYIKNGVKVVVK